MNIEELKLLAEAATPGPWTARNYIAGVGCGVDSPLGDVCHHTTRAVAEYIAAANPAAVLELIAEIERVTKQRDEMLTIGEDAA